MLKFETLLEQSTGPFSRFRAHHFTYAPPGEVNEGIWHRIRGGEGSTFTFVVGAEVEGHGHIPKEDMEKIFPGAQTWEQLPDRRWALIEYDEINGMPRSDDAKRIIQQGEDEIGFHYFGIIKAITNRHP